MRGAQGATALLIAIYAGACLVATPFGTDPPARGLTEKNLQKLRLRPSQSPFRFIAMGELHQARDELSEAIDAINRRTDIEFVAIAGDVTDQGLLQEYEWFYDQVRRLRVPYFLAIGNHDALSSGKEIYAKMFGPLNYSFEFGGDRFLFFNSNALEFPGAAPDWSWLTSAHEQLAGQHAVWVTHHDPLHPDDLPGGHSRDDYENLLSRFDVALVAHAHLETFELERFGTVPILQCPAFEKTYEYTIVTRDGAESRFENCHRDSCIAVFPSGESGP